MTKLEVGYAVLPTALLIPTLHRSRKPLRAPQQKAAELSPRRLSFQPKPVDQKLIVASMP
jgi:hypothetical protein